MFKKLAASMLIAAIVITLGGSSAFAGKLSEPAGTTPAPTSDQNRTKSESSQKLRSAMDNLVSDTKAGKINIAERPQMQPAKSNNLSTTTKVLIGVGIAVAVIAIIVINHDRDSAISIF